ncbi:MAG: GNAT family N-acetyltransferase [Terrisporobacter sp.]
MDDVIIKPATSKDIKNIVIFEKEARLTEPGVLYWNIDEKEYTDKLKELNIEKLENSKIIIAKQQEKIIGRCDISIMLSLVNCEKTGYIDWIYTLKGYRGKGIGKKMLKGAEDYFKDRNVVYYFLITASNEQAHEFYHRQSDLKFYNREVAEKNINKVP